MKYNFFFMPFCFLFFSCNSKYTTISEDDISIECDTFYTRTQMSVMGAYFKLVNHSNNDIIVTLNSSVDDRKSFLYISPENDTVAFCNDSYYNLPPFIMVKKKSILRFKQIIKNSLFFKGWNHTKRKNKFNIYLANLLKQSKIIYIPNSSTLNEIRNKTHNNVYSIDGIYNISTDSIIMFPNYAGLPWDDDW